MRPGRQGLLAALEVRVDGNRFVWKPILKGQDAVGEEGRRLIWFRRPTDEEQQIVDPALSIEPRKVSFVPMRVSAAAIARMNGK